VTTTGAPDVTGGAAVTPEPTVLVVAGGAAVTPEPIVLIVAGEGGRFMLIVTPELENVSIIAILIS
jgi:hypothetical protein